MTARKFKGKLLVDMTKIPGTIRPLSTEVINQIAAGEVVERPANLVKELIENSLDAGADKIEIHFSDGGRFVQIKDNGCGIKDTELPLALSPHSTSKISSLQDIWAIGSYGFRGEALAGIAEVSDLTLVSKPESQSRAGCLRSEFGKKTPVESVGSEKGTTVIVKNLFEKTPARLKFLKAESSETALIKNIIKAMALSRPQVEFRVLYKKKLLFYWPAKDSFQKRTEEVLSLKNTFYTKTQYQDIKVEAVLCAPNDTSATRRNLWFFVGGRYVEDSAIYSAVMAAYRGLLLHGEYPIVAINIFCRQEDLDVNVHPAKSKVRFKKPSLIFKAVHGSLRAVLEKAPWIPTGQSKTPAGGNMEKELAFPGPAFNKTHFPAKARESDSPSNPHTFTKPAGKNEFSSSYPAIPSGQTGDIRSALKNMKMEEAQNIKKENNYWSSLYILSQAHLTYILAQTRSAIVFVDQHAAHERILYERLMQSWNTGKGDVQNRLVPLALDMDESLVKTLLSVQKELLKLGLKMEQAGPDGLVIHSAPAVLKDLALQKALTKLAEEIRSVGGSFAVEKKISDLCGSMACHSAVRAGQALSREEMQDLLTQMDEFPLSSFCPHGRPVFVEYPLSRLEKDFCRRI